eukprot:s228_g20.t1
MQFQQFFFDDLISKSLLWSRRGFADAALIVVLCCLVLLLQGCRESSLESLARVMQVFNLCRWSPLPAWLRKPSPCQVGLHVQATWRAP